PARSLTRLFVSCIQPSRAPLSENSVPSPLGISICLVFTHATPHAPPRHLANGVIGRQGVSWWQNRRKHRQYTRGHTHTHQPTSANNSARRHDTNYNQWCGG